MKTPLTRIHRRTLLRGAGVAMALPWLESIPVWGTEAATGGTAPAFPKRFAALFMGNGISPNSWWAKGTGREMELSTTLEPMEPFKTRLNVITGLFNKNATGVGIHPGQTGNILSGAALQKGAVLKGGISMDQVLANQLGEETAQASLVLGCEQPITGYHESNFSMAYSSHISWQNAFSPVPMEVYPSLAFDSLFDNQGSKRAIEHSRPRQGACQPAFPASQPGRSGEARRISHQCAGGRATDPPHPCRERRKPTLAPRIAVAAH